MASSVSDPIRDDALVAGDQDRHRRDHGHHVDIELARHQRVGQQHGDDPADAEAIERIVPLPGDGDRGDGGEEPGEEIGRRVQQVVPGGRLVHPGREGAADGLLHDHVVCVRVAAEEKGGDQPEQRDHDHRRERGEVIRARHTAAAPALQAEEDERDDGGHRTLDQGGDGDGDGGVEERAPVIVLQEPEQHPATQRQKRREPHIHPRGLRGAPHHQRRSADERGQPVTHPREEPEQQRERGERRDDERPHRVEAERKRQQVDEPEVQRRFVRERRAVERGKEKRSVGTHLANDLPVLRLVADEKLAPRRSQKGRKEEQNEECAAPHA